MNTIRWDKVWTDPGKTELRFTGRVVDNAKHNPYLGVHCIIIGVKSPNVLAQIRAMGGNTWAHRFIFPLIVWLDKLLEREDEINYRKDIGIVRDGE